MGSGDITTADVQAFLEAFLNMSPRFAYLIDDTFFSGEKQNFWSWDYSLKGAGQSGFPDYQMMD